MTITSTSYAPEEFLITGPQSYTFTFQHIGVGGISVYEVYSSGLSVLVTDTVDYTITYPAQPATSNILTGGIVTFLRAHPVDVVSVTVARTTPASQLVEYGPYLAFPAETHEFALDKLTLRSQENTYDATSGGAGESSPTVHAKCTVNMSVNNSGFYEVTNSFGIVKAVAVGTGQAQLILQAPASTDSQVLITTQSSLLFAAAMSYAWNDASNVTVSYKGMVYDVGRQAFDEPVFSSINVLSIVIYK